MVLPDLQRDLPTECVAVDEQEVEDGISYEKPSDTPVRGRAIMQFLHDAGKYTEYPRQDSTCDCAIGTRIGDRFFRRIHIYCLGFLGREDLVHKELMDDDDSNVALLWRSSANELLDKDEHAVNHFSLHCAYPRQGPRNVPSNFEVERLNVQENLLEKVSKWTHLRERTLSDEQDDSPDDLPPAEPLPDVEI
eukprot:352677-Amorphochlora_amoeboformis.AAC.1